MFRLRTAHALLPVLVLTGAITGQKPAVGSKSATRATRLIAGLADDAQWERSAAGLVLLREAAALPLAAALLQAAEDDKDELARRILLVLERMGMDARDAAGAVWDAMHDLSVGNAGLALGVVAQISPAGGAEFVNHLQGVLSKVLGGGQVDRKKRQEFMHRLNTSMSLLQAKKNQSPDASLAELRAAVVKTDPGGVVCCQLLGRRGKAARPALAALAEQVKPLSPSQRASPRLTRGRIDSVTIRRTFAVAILRIDPMSPQAAVAHGFLILHEPFRELRLRSARELMMLGPHLEEAVPHLDAFLNRGAKDTELLHMVLNCLALAGPNAQVAMPRIEKLCKSNNPKTAARAKAALQRIRAPK